MATILFRTCLNLLLLVGTAAETLAGRLLIEGGGLGDFLANLVEILERGRQHALHLFVHLGGLRGIAGLGEVLGLLDQAVVLPVRVQHLPQGGVDHLYSGS